MILSRVLAWLREEPNKGDFTKGKIKYGKDAITLGSDERSATPADKLRTVRFLLAKSPTTGLNVLKMGCRDYAILLLLARLGLRSGEVVFLELNDIDWNAGELSVRGKSGRRRERHGFSMT
jgi:integrase